MNERVQVFREEPGFLKLFSLFKEKYRSLGRIGGTVSIKSFSNTEVDSIAGFLGQSVDVLLQKGNVALVAFEKELSQTGFADYTLIQLLEEVLEETIITKLEENSLEEEKEKIFFEDLRLTYPDGSWWWDWIQSKPPDSRWIWALYWQNSDDLMEKLHVVFNAFQNLPCNNSKYERLPLFSQRITGNPHFFDTNQLPGRLLSYCMQVDQQLNGMRDPGMPKTTEELNDLLSRYGLMRDDLWSFVSCSGLLAEWETGIHPVWQAAANSGTVLNVPIKELLKIKRIWPNHGKKVWIVENSSVCSTIVDEVANAPVICTHGQFRAASWIMLDLLIESGCQLYYSGDIDPEGISMAQRLKNRYNDQVTCWRMDKASYEKTISDEDISSRLSKMEFITSAELVDVVNALKNAKMAGYQEGIVNELIEDIKGAFEK
jgi:uncharacterized protein (TIGR02679 family)